MSAAVPNKKRKLAKFAGSIYFIVLGLANVIGTAIYSDNLGWKDFLVLALFCTPLLINKKIYYLLFGGISVLLWGSLIFGVFSRHRDIVRGVSDYTNPDLSLATAATIGYLFTFVSLFFALCVLYAGMSDSEPESDKIAS